MAYSAFVGAFNLDSSVTAGNDQSVTGVGFEPKVVLFWWAGGTSSSDEVAGGDICIGFGTAISSSSRFAVACASDDAQATSDACRGQTNAGCIYIFSDGSATVDGIADFSSMDADGFTLTIDNQFGSDWRVSYLALGGSDLTNVAIGTATRDTSTGNESFTGVGFQPEAIIVSSALVQSAAATGTHNNFGFGWATGSGAQGTVTVSSQDNQSTTDTSGYGYNSEFHSVIHAGGNPLLRDAFVSFDADGFTINQLENSSAYVIHYVCLAGGQYEVGELTTRTDGNDIEENLTGAYEPVAVLFASANRAHCTQDTATDHARMSIGAASATDERSVQAISDEHNLATTETAYTNQDDAVYAHVVDDAIEALMDIKSFDADGFTCVMDDTESSACWVTYLAIGAAAAAGGRAQINPLRGPVYMRRPV